MVFAIIWFHGVEFRIFFIMVMTTLPAFTFQVLGALRGMSKDLMEMVFSFRPTRLKLFRVMIAPAILPDILTAWKVNLGNASRVVVVAELVGATGGVGYQLLQQQQLFDMAGRAGLDAATGVFRADRAGRADTDRKYRVPLPRGVGARDMSDIGHADRGRHSPRRGLQGVRQAGQRTRPIARWTASISMLRPARCWRCSARPAAASRRSST